jgi:RNA polymerase sigma-70 factor (ECF subfamily)
MAMTDPNEAAERLARHAPFLRALAEALLGRDDAADDVLQDAWLATRGSAPIDPRRERGWLAGVVRNLSLHRLRERSRRAARESARQGAREVPTPHQVLEEEAARRRILEAVLALEEPWRAVLLLRFWEGRTLAEVAAQTGAPLETVRARQKRALELLRQRLDREFGSRASWGAVLAPIVGMTATKTGAAGAATTIPFLWGSIAMGVKTWVIAAGALAAVAASLVWWSMAEGRGGAPAARGGGDGARLVANEKKPNESAPAAPAGESRAAVESASRPAAATRITGRFLDREARPVAGVQLFPAVSKRATFDVAMANPGPTPAPGPPVAESNDRGEFVWSDASAVILGNRSHYSWLALRNGFAMKKISAEAASGETTALGDIVLDPGGDLAGVVVDSTGKPVRAMVELWPSSAFPKDVPIAKAYRPSGSTMRALVTQADGTFEVLGATCDSIRVSAARTDSCYAFTDPFSLAPGERRANLRLVLEPLPDECAIDGKVVKPDGTPCPGAEIRYTVGGSLGMFFAERDGGFHHRLHGPGLSVRYQASDPKGEFCVARSEGVVGGTHDLVLKLEPLRACVVQLKSSAGGPISRARLRVDDGFMKPMGDDLFLDDPKGEIRILALPAPFRIEVEADGHEPKKVGPLERESLPATLEITLQKVASISGRVLRDGKPYAGAIVTVEGAVRNGRRDGFPCRSVPIDEMHFAKTDADGRFDLWLSKPLRFAFVRAEGGARLDDRNPTIAPAEIGPLSFDPKVGLEGLELILGNGGSIEGRLLLPSGRDATGLIVGVSRGDGHPRSMKLTSDGAYRFTNLIPGRYAVAILDDHADWSSSVSLGEALRVEELPYQCVVDAGRMTHFDLDLRAGVDVALVGHLLLGSKSWEGFEARATPSGATGSEVKSAVAADGRYRLALPHGGRWAIEFARPGDPESFSLRLALDVGAIGETQSQFSPAAGSIRGTLKGIAPPAQTNVQYWRSSPDIAYLAGSVVPAEDGTFAIPSLPAGPIHLTLVGPDGKEIVRRDVDVAVGVETKVEMP